MNSTRVSLNHLPPCLVPGRATLRSLLVTSAAAVALFASSCSFFHKDTFDPAAQAKATANPDFESTKPPEPINPAWMQPPVQDTVLGAGDRLEIEILGEADSKDKVLVSPDGKIYYNLLPGIDVQGRTVESVRKEMEQKLTQFYRHPQLSVTMADISSQRVWVLGRVNSPGNYPLNRPMRVLDAIAQGGGLFTSRMNGTNEELADLEHSFLIRKGKMLPIDFKRLLQDGDMRYNIYLQPGDYIYLPSSLSNEIYVLGGVAGPRPVPYTSDLNIVSAIGHASGLTSDAEPSHVTIVRGSLQEPKIATVNLDHILRGKSKNLRLQPGDIVYVPTTGMFNAGNYLNLVLTSFARSVGATAGTSAVSNVGVTPTVSVGIGDTGSAAAAPSVAVPTTANGTGVKTN
jgi:protein involved in polysaccharide export with SLBB domain